MENLLKKIEELREKMLDTWRLLDIDRKISVLHSQKQKLNSPDFWNDREEAVRISKEIEELEKEVREWQDLRQEITELEEFVAFALQDAQNSASQADEEIVTQSQHKLEELEKSYEALEFFVLFNGPYDRGNAILSIHAGTGGVDAQDWAQILERMFLRFAEKMGWTASILDRTYGNEAGIKSSMIKVAGLWAYGYLQSENGVHRLVRISPFDAESMRHTSFALVEVIPELPDTAEVELKDEELRIDVFRSSGPGGQSVNTTDSAIRIVHIPTGITVTCQTERSQHQNRENALRILRSKLFQFMESERKQEEQKLKGAAQKAEWGKQIRSYVLQPYQLAKDHRTGHETADISSVLDGDLAGFCHAYLRNRKK